MSKLAIVLCAVAAFFASTKHNAWGIKDITNSPHLALLNKRTIDRKINEAIADISRRYEEVYEEMMNIPLVDVEKSKVERRIYPYLDQLGTHLLKLESKVRYLVHNTGSYGTDNQKCLGYYDDHVAFINKEVIETMNSTFDNQHQNAFIKMTRLFDDANADMDKVRKLKVKADSCIGIECFYIVGEVNRRLAIFFENAFVTFENYKSMANGTSTEKELRTLLDYYVNMGSEVLRATNDCLQNRIVPQNPSPPKIDYNDNFSVPDSNLNEEPANSSEIPQNL